MHANQRMIRQQQAPPPGNWAPVSWQAFTDDVLAIYAKNPKKTQLKMRQILREFGELTDAKGRRLITLTGDLRPGTVAAWRNAEKYAKRRPATVVSLLKTLHSAVGIGLASGYMLRNPILAQHWPTDLEPDEEETPADRDDDRGPTWHPIADIRKVLMHMEEQAALSWVNHRLFVMTSLVALTGVRKMEALTLQVQDLYLDGDCPHIRIPKRRAITSRRSGRRVRKQKTKASAAPVGMPAELVDILYGWLPHIQKVPERWLIPQLSLTAPWTESSPGYTPLDRMKAAAESVGVKGFTFLSLRHSWSTHAEYWGLGEALIQRQLRHTKPSTQQVYRHADVANLARAVNGISFLSEPSAQRASDARPWSNPPGAVPKLPRSGVN